MKFKPDWHKVLLYAVIIICAWIILGKSCKCKKTSDENPPAPVDKVREVIVKDTLLAKKIRDSFTLVFNKRDIEDNKNRATMDRLVAENIQLYNDQAKYIVPEYADTCKEVVNFLNKKYNDYSTQTQNTLTASRNTVNGLNNTIATQKSALSKKDQLYNQLRKDVDTCLKTAKDWHTYANKLKSRSFIYAGVSILGEPNRILNGYGVELGLTNKRGTSFGASVININNTLNYGIVIRKRIFKL